MKDANQGNKGKRLVGKAPAELNAYPGYLILRLHQISVAHFTRLATEEGLDLTPVQFAALNTIVQSPGLDQITVANLISYDRVTIGGVIDRLERKELIVRRLSKSDRRARELVPTDNGRKILAKLLPVVATSQKQIFGNLNKSEETDFIRLLTKVVGDHSARL